MHFHSMNYVVPPQVLDPGLMNLTTLGQASLLITILSLIVQILKEKMTKFIILKVQVLDLFLNEICPSNYNFIITSQLCKAGHPLAMSVSELLL